MADHHLSSYIPYAQPSIPTTPPTNNLFNHVTVETNLVVAIPFPTTPQFFVAVNILPP
jgi:hypothetical protein